MNTVKIQTTQNVEVEYPLASVGDRIIATIIDGVVMVVWALAISTMFAFANWFEDGAGLVALAVLVYIPLLFYHLVCEIFLNGQSIGKRARDIKVIKLNGNSPTVGDYLLRWIFRLVDMGISSGIVAVVAVAASGKGQRLGDMAAGTCVIRTRAVRRRAPEMMQIEEDYQIVFPEVNLLSDQDLAQVRKLVSKAQEHQNYELLEKVAQRVKEITGIQTEMSDWDFLKTVVKDYQHYTHGEVEVQ